MPQSRNLELCLAGLCLALWSTAAAAATWSTSADLSLERTTDVTVDGVAHTDEYDQSYTLSYATNLFENLEFTLDFALDVDQTRESPGFTTRDTKPSVDATLTAQWWDLSASWDETKTTNTDPAEARTVESNWEFEAVVEPEYEVLPAFRFNIQGGNDDVLDRALELNFEYSLLDLVDLTFDVTRDTTDDPEPDADTEDRKYAAEISIQKDLTSALSLEADWTNEREQNITLTDQHEVLARDDTLSNDLRGKLEWNLLDLVTTSVERETQWDADLGAATQEVTDTWTEDVEFDHDLTDALHLNLSYGDERENARPVGPHTYSITRDYTAELELAPFEWFSIKPSFDRSDKIQWSKEPDSEADDTLDDTYEVLFNYALWKEFLVLEVTRTWDFSWEKDQKTTEERSWDVSLDFAPLYIPNLEIKPTYSYTQDRDAILATTDADTSIDVDIGYEISINDRLVLTLDHTYSRTKNWPADATMTVERTDDTDVTLAWNEFLRGMTSEVSMTRAASDTSGDDKGPEIDYTYGVTYDWEFLSDYTLSFEYNRDVKQESEDTQDFTTTVAASFFDGRITLDLEHEFDQQLEGEPNDTHRYLIELQGEF